MGKIIFVVVIVMAVCAAIVMGFTSQIENAGARRAAANAQEQEARAQAEIAKAEQIRARGEAEAQIILANTALSQAGEPTRLMIIGLSVLTLIVVALTLIPLGYLIIARRDISHETPRASKKDILVLESPDGAILVMRVDSAGKMHPLGVIQPQKERKEVSVYGNKQLR